MAPAPSKVQAFRGFINVTAENASMRTAPRLPPSERDIPLTHLVLTDSQRVEIECRYSHQEVFSRDFDTATEDEQIVAASFLATNRLDLDARECLDNKWVIRWSAKSAGETQRVLYQCACGCSQDIRESNARHTPVGFTGCLAHAEVVYDKTYCVRYIRGVFEHNQECERATFIREPTFPIDPAVYQIALKQMKAGVPLEMIKETNQNMFLTKAYPTQRLPELRYRHLLTKKDTRSLYRQYHRLQGVRVAQHDHINLDEWLNPNSPHYQPVLREAIFHYSP
ncbi:hypothetical protein NM688_g7639 [Phlebia brevispora]|uniref:Uncharacterized protein n=1 Tax=Phlebia brevispora TaxID=194682 RepID=A0ACC1S2U7_9APHY|nr:hypothetical protein NM688_g7639 [Phlebia brevispora]